MTDTWAAKVLEGVVRLDTDPNDYSSLIPTKDGSLVSYDNALAAIARMGAGDGWFDVFKNIATEAERVAAYEKTRAEAAEAEAAALRAKVARLERAGDFARLIGNDDGRDDKETVLVSYGMLRRLRAAIGEGGKDG